MVNPKSLENLKQYRNGSSPKHVKTVGDISLTSALKRYLKLHPAEVDALAACWFRAARTNPSFAKEILDRLEGKVAQPVTGAGGGPVEILVRWDGNRNAGMEPGK